MAKTYSIAWSDGFVAGQVTTYCEAITRGSRLVAQVAFPRRCRQTVLKIVKQEGCKATAAAINDERLSVWIYRDDAAMDLVKALHSTPSGKLAQWNMGKLFGYADEAVIKYLKET
jgi:hypothetical protein